MIKFYLKKMKTALATTKKQVIKVGLIQNAGVLARKNPEKDLFI
jgi:hypothetical protein